MSRFSFTRRFRLLWVRLLASGAALASAGAAHAAPPVWRVAGAHVNVELFGSIHLLSAATAWRTPTLDADIAKAGAIWFEIPLGAGAQGAAMQMMQAKGMLAPGEQLSTLLPLALTERVDTLAKGEGLAPAVVERMKPWLAELVLTVAFYQRQGYREDLGVEAQIDALAPPAARREAFETLADQVDLFAEAPLPEQIASLKETLDEIDTDPKSFARAADAWRRGDVRALAAEVVDPIRKEDVALYRRVLVDRNHRFAARIEQMLRNGQGRVLVVVGAGHLVGPDGVPALLRQDGFSVEGP